MQSIFRFYFNILIWFSFNLKFMFQLLLQKDINVHKKMYKIVGISLSIASSCVRCSQKNRQAVEEESYPGEIELQNEGSSKY